MDALEGSEERRNKIILRAPLASRGWLGTETGRRLRRPPRGWRGCTRGSRGPALAVVLKVEATEFQGTMSGFSGESGPGDCFCLCRVVRGSGVALQTWSQVERGFWAPPAGSPALWFH